jgi:hypothetical protein
LEILLLHSIFGLDPVVGNVTIQIVVDVDEFKVSVEDLLLIFEFNH